MTDIRLKEVWKGLKGAKESLSKEIKYVAATRSKTNTRMAWAEVQEISNEI